jgi:hypothetical protein
LCVCVCVCVIHYSQSCVCLSHCPSKVEFDKSSSNDEDIDQF